MSRCLRTWLWFVLLLVPVVAEAGTVQGRVFADTDGDGQISIRDTPIAGAVVVWEDSQFTRTAADGSFQLAAPGAGLVWVRPPDGYSPAPVWRAVTADGGAIQLLLEPVPAPTLPLRFVHVSDLHIGGLDGDAVGRALRQALGPGPAPAFVVATGDLTQSSHASEFAAARAIFDALPVPVVPGLGNHDWYDGGVNYRAQMGPPAYSFDMAGVHFIMLHGNAPVPQRLQFVAKDLSFVAPGTPVYAFIHYPITLPYDKALYDGLVAAGVTHLFTGHFHANRTITFPGLTEHNVQPLGMGGIQLIPGGYEVVTVVDGVPHTAPKFVVNAPVTTVVSPPDGGCVAPGEVPIVVAAELGLGAPSVTASVDGAPPVTLAAAGGWDYRGTATITAPGPHALTAQIDQGDTHLTASSSFCVRDLPAVTVASAWPQLGGGPQHDNAMALTVDASLGTLWTQTVGGFVLGGSPVLADGRLFVPVADFGTEARGGVVALDAATGQRLWEARVGSLQSAPAVDGDLVIIAPIDGVLRAYHAASGQLAWSYDLGAGEPAQQRGMYSAPLVAGGVVYAGQMYHFAALDSQTGAVLWDTHPSSATFVGLTQSTPAADDNRLVAVFGQGGEGVHAWDATRGAPLWNHSDGHVVGLSAPPTLRGGVGYFGTSDGNVFAEDLATGDVRWRTPLVAGGADFSFWVRAAPALAGERVYVATQKDGVYAAATNDGAVKWRAPGGASLVRAVSYEDHTQGFSSSPVVTGNLVWIAGDDGVLRALDVTDGTTRWSRPLGVPVLSGVIPGRTLSGDGMLFVASFDGTVRALVADPDNQLGEVQGCSCDARGARPPGSSVLVLGLGLVAWRRRRPPQMAGAPRGR